MPLFTLLLRDASFFSSTVDFRFSDSIFSKDSLTILLPFSAKNLKLGIDLKTLLNRESTV